MSLSHQSAQPNILSQVLDGCIEKLSRAHGVPLETHVKTTLNLYKTKLRAMNQPLENPLTEGIIEEYIRSEFRRVLKLSSKK